MFKFLKKNKTEQEQPKLELEAVEVPIETKTQADLFDDAVKEVYEKNLREEVEYELMCFVYGRDVADEYVQFSLDKTYNKVFLPYSSFSIYEAEKYFSEKYKKIDFCICNRAYASEIICKQSKENLLDDLLDKLTNDLSNTQ